MYLIYPASCSYYLTHLLSGCMAIHPWPREQMAKETHVVKYKNHTTRRLFLVSADMDERLANRKSVELH